MFKELGEFIDNVGRATGYAVKRLLSNDEPFPMTGYEDTDGFPDEYLPEGLKEELEKHEDVKVWDDINKDDV